MLFPHDYCSWTCYWSHYFYSNKTWVGIMTPQQTSPHDTWLTLLSLCCPHSQVDEAGGVNPNVRQPLPCTHGGFALSQGRTRPCNHLICFHIHSYEAVICPAHCEARGCPLCCSPRGPAGLCGPSQPPDPHRVQTQTQWDSCLPIIPAYGNNLS